MGYKSPVDWTYSISSVKICHSLGGGHYLSARDGYKYGVTIFSRPLMGVSLFIGGEGYKYGIHITRLVYVQILLSLKRVIMKW